MGKPGTEKEIAKIKQPRKGRGPCVEVDVPITTVRKSFSVKEPLAKVLTEYAAFLSEHHGKAIDEDRVIDGLIDGLRRDPLFAAWAQRDREG
jgi:hypothetical protein